jgi:hypothetical protein
MRCRRHPRPAFQDYRNGLITCQLISGNNKKAQVCTSLYTPVLSDGCGSGGWIRTTDLRVMSPTSCHCSTPRCGGARTYSPGGRPASTIGAAAFHDPVRDGAGWVRGASRTPLVQGGGSAHLILRLQRRHVRRPSREALVHAHASPLPLAGPPAGAACPVVFRGTYRPDAVSGVILGGISRLDAFSGSCLRTWLRSLRAAPQLLHQRSVHSGPLVLRAAPRTPLCARSG